MEPTEDPLPISLAVILSEVPVSYYFTIGIALLLLLFVSAIASGTEVAFFSLPGNENEKPRMADSKILKLLNTPRQLLATILILNNLVNVSIVTLSTFATWTIIGQREASAGVLLLLTTATTVLIVFFGEIVPKVYASHNPWGFARFSVGFISFCHTLLRPLSWGLISMSRIIEHRIEQKGYNVSVDELNHALDLTAEDTDSDVEKGILKGIVNFGTYSVKKIMHSRLDIMAIDIETDFHELMDQINKSGFSRIPVYKETIDKIEGILYIKDLLPHIDKDEHFAWQTLLRPAYFVPGSKKLDDLFKDFQKKRVHMAIVIDEYGGTEGLITMEDIIEEIVGEINDEFDEEDETKSFKKLGPSSYMFEGKTSLNDFCKIVHTPSDTFDEVKGESESLGGLLLELHSKMPHTGEKISFGEFIFTITSVDQKRIKKIRVDLQTVSSE